MSTILSGIPLRDKIREDLATVVSFIPADEVPQLAIIQVGSLEASNVYIKGKIKFGEAIGVPVALHQLPEAVSEEQLIDLVISLNVDARVGGIIVQLPLPEGISDRSVIETIDPEKDVDGLHSKNVKKLFTEDASGIVPATARGVMSLLDFNDIELKGKKALVIGRSALVGKPIAMSLLNRDATVTIAHHETVDLPSVCREADIIVVAAGAPGLITKDYIKPGQIIIDVGITRKDGEIHGDVAYDEVFSIVEAVSPVPGGVGPLTIASLFQNLLRKYTDDISN